MSVRHILSTARAQTPVHFAAVEAVKSDSLNPRVKKSITKAPVIWPKPCMEKTAAIIAPRHLVVANLKSVRIEVVNFNQGIIYSEVMILDKG